ncbi:MAG: LacI family transcriptional regulator [Bacteroidetes bacterium HGW-Bacteroidetes-22]|nr:MAG: LacI family transcriptional regulator [Bacteroidetes bacterium HGW-Bacteroidetes-22]
MKKVVLNDIAVSLGVSKALVSMVLNHQGDKNGISKATQEKVWLKARELNYIPNHIARGLRLGKSMMIGLIVPDIANIFFSRIARIIEDITNKAGYNLIISSSDENIERELQLIRKFTERQVDGLIVATTQSNKTEFLQLKRDGFPIVLIDRSLNINDIDYIGVDNTAGSFNAVNHLIDEGYRKIALLKPGPSHLKNLRDRETGFRKALKNAGIRINERFIREIPFTNLDAKAEDELKDLVKLGADAIFAINNRLAVSTLQFARKNNINIPEELGLITFDDLDLFEIGHPTVSAVSQPVAQIAEAAANKLLDKLRLNKPETLVQHFLLSTQFIPRESSAHFKHKAEASLKLFEIN